MELAVSSAVNQVLQGLTVNVVQSYPPPASKQWQGKSSARSPQPGEPASQVNSKAATRLNFTDRHSNALMMIGLNPGPRARTVMPCSHPINFPLLYGNGLPRVLNSPIMFYYLILIIGFITCGNIIIIIIKGHSLRRACLLW